MDVRWVGEGTRVGITHSGTSRSTPRLRGKQWEIGVDGWTEQSVKVLRRSGIWNLKGI